MHQAERVRQLIQSRFVELGASPDAPVQETILIRDGYYCGRKMRCDGLQAIWFVEENEIKFYDRDGAVASVCDAVIPEAPAARKAG
ncbi:hypothetical protein Pla8534_41030 [Lignipirellula cremea]|uniref:Uncharacterized protein n=1 Tax=Lignipirellula cremea TaxID=2528010 RepID=A0A518DWS3_9BACT|nr:hypothetical protein Pla8534_41030 [Lignipirellula cremea]